MGYQLVIESFLLETFSERVREKVNNVVRHVRRIMMSGQLPIDFNPKPEGLCEMYMQFDRTLGYSVKKYRLITMDEKKTGKVGSPVKMRKIIKDEPYLRAI